MFFFLNEKECVNFFWSCSNEALDIHAFLKGSRNVNYTLKLNLFKYSKNADIAYESDKDASRPVALNSLITLSSIWQLAVFPYI